MNTQNPFLRRMPILDAAIYVSLAAVFLAISLPLVRGAYLRHQMAECARKMMWAADALDAYAAAVGDYPDDGRGADANNAGEEILNAFAVLNIDWWGESTELGGDWNWFRGHDCGTIAISNPNVSERRMRQLDLLIDDGDLSNGTFRRYGSIYCYVLKQKGCV